MDPVATVVSIIKVIGYIEAAVKEVQENQEQCEYLAHRLAHFEIILHDVNLRSHAKFSLLVASLKALVDEAHEFIVSLLPQPARKAKNARKTLIQQVNRVKTFLFALTQRRAHAKRFLFLDAKLSNLRDDFNAISAILSRAAVTSTEPAPELTQKSSRVLLELIAKDLHNDIVRELLRVRDDVERGEALPDDFDALCDAPAQALATVEALANEFAQPLESDEPRRIAALQQFVDVHVQQIVSLSQAPRITTPSSSTTLLHNAAIDDSDMLEPPPFRTADGDDDGDAMLALFRLDGRLGDPGAYGTTHTATYLPTGRIYALKRVDVAHARQRGLRLAAIAREADSLQRLRHAHIVRCWHSFFDDAERHFFVVMDHVDGRTLEHVLRHETGTPTALVHRWFRQLLSAFVYMHQEAHVIHRDVKPANILVTHSRDDVRLVDFGVARQLPRGSRNDADADDDEGQRLTAQVGTPLYMSLEKLSGLPYDGRDDVWAAGCVFLELTLREPLRRVTLARDDVTRHAMLQRATHADPALGPVLQRILGVAPQAMRPTAAEALVAFDTSDLVTATPSAAVVTATPPPSAPLPPLPPLPPQPPLAAVPTAAPAVVSPRNVPSPVSSTIDDAVNDADTTGNATGDATGDVIGDGPRVPLAQLDGDETVRLLVNLGCRADLRQSAATLLHGIDGAFIAELDSIDALVELEQAQASAVRQTQLRRVLKALHALREAGGLPPSLYRRVSADGERSARAEAVAQRHRRHLDAPLQATFDALLANNARLTTLTLPRRGTSAAATLAIVEALSVNTQLVTLCLAGLPLSRATIQALGEALCQNGGLRALNVSHCVGGTTAAAAEVAMTLAEALAMVLRSHQTLTSLEAEGNAFGDTGIATMAAALRNGGGGGAPLRTLQLARTALGSVGTTRLAEAIASHATLATLDVSGNTALGDDGARALATMLTTNASLTALHCAACRIGATGGAALAAALRINRSLCTLITHRNPLGATAGTAIARALATNTTLTALDASDASFNALTMVAFATDWRKPRALDLSRNALGASSRRFFEALTASPAAVATLTTLALREVEIGPTGGAALAVLVARAPALRLLDIAKNPLGTSAGVALAQAIGRHTALTSVDLDATSQGVAAAVAWGEALAHHASLTSLHLGQLSFSARGNVGGGVVGGVFASLGFTSSVSSSTNDAAAVGGFTAALATNNTLRTLALGGCALGDDGVVRLATALRSPSVAGDSAAAAAAVKSSPSSLTALHLSLNDVSSTGAEALAKALAASLTSLVMLDLSHNRIGATGAAALADALTRNTTLTTLNVSANDIGDAGVRAMAMAIAASGNMTLTTLHISLNGVSSAGIAAITAALRIHVVC